MLAGRPMQFDAVIAGGGLAGLSLAARLATGGWRNRSVLIVDDEAAEPAATSWASWASAPELLDPAVSRAFTQVRVHAGGTHRVVPLEPYRYRVVRRHDLRRLVMSMVDTCPRFAVTSGRVQSVSDGPGAAQVVVDGRMVRASWVFDSVTPEPARDVDARLAFTGWEIRADRPVFDPWTPTLFDFRTPQVGGARFVYVLPEDSRHALVELTEFVPRSCRPPTAFERRDALGGYLRDVVHAGDFEVLRVESAVLPLRATPADRGRGRIRKIGAHGGLVKASTGYAFERIQRDSDAIAASLDRHGHPFAVALSSARHRRLDAVLLDVLDRHPAELERTFAALFTSNPARRVLRFLDEDSSVAEELCLIASLPPMPYLRAMAGRALHRSQPGRTT